MVKSHASTCVWARRGWLGAAAAAAALTVTACGSVKAGSGTAANPPSSSAPATAPAAPSPGGPVQGSVPLGSGPPVCAAIPQLRTLTVTRVVVLHNQLHFPFPARVELTAPAAVQAVATAACQLPELPRTLMTCPADLGISYRLTFATASETFSGLTASATGCSKLNGLDTVREAAPSFWATLGRAMHLTVPSAVTFGGHPA